MTVPQQAARQEWASSGEGHPRRWSILGVLVVSLLIVVLDNTILNIALPTIQSSLNATQSELVWAVDSYILVFAALLFTWGVLGDKYGRKRILIIGLTIFVLASAASAFAVNAQMLIAFRALMGVGGAAVMPVTLAIITVVFAPHERGKAIGLWAAAVGGAVALGPVLGGLLLEHPEWSSWLTGNDWGSVFLVNVPIIIIGLIGIIKVVPETRNPHPQRLDIPGLLMSFTGLVLLVFGIIHASDARNFLVPMVWGPILVGVLVLALWLWLEARSDHRSFDVALFKNRGYAVSLAAVSMAFFALSGITFTLPFYLQVLRGYTTLQAGLFFLPFALGQLLSAPRSAALVLRFGYRIVITTGLSIVFLALVAMTRLNLDTPPWYALAAFFCFGLGMGLVVAPASTLMQNVLPLARAGAGSAVQNTVRQVFGALGVAVISTILANVFASRWQPVVDTFADRVPEQVRAESLQSIGNAVAVLGRLGNQGVNPDAIAAARLQAFESFMHAANVTAWVSATIVLAAAIVVVTLLPKIEPPRAGTPHIAHDEVETSGTPSDDTHIHRIDAPDWDEAKQRAAELESSYSEEASEEYLGTETEGRSDGQPHRGS